MLPDEPGNTYAVVYTTNWDYAATAALAGVFALIFQEPLVNVGRFASEPERDGEQYRWFIPSGRPLGQTSLGVILSAPLLWFPETRKTNCSLRPNDQERNTCLAFFRPLR